MRDQPLAAVTARLDRIEAVGDPALALEPGALADARRLADALGDDDGDVEARSVLGRFHWYRYLVLPQDRKDQALAEAIRALIPCFIAGVTGLPEPLLPWLAEKTVGAAVALSRRAVGTKELPLITAAVSLWQRVLTATSTDHPDRAGHLAHLAVALGLRFEEVGALADLDEAIVVGRAAVHATSADDPNRSVMLSNLGIALQSRFERVDALVDLDEAIVVLRQAVEVTAVDHPDWAGCLFSLGFALYSRFERVDALVDLDEAILVLRQAVETTAASHPDRAVRLSGLYLALRVRFERHGELADLDEAIVALRQVVEATAVGCSDRAEYLSNLGAHLKIRFDWVGTQADLDEMITVFRQAVEATAIGDPVRAMSQSNLGIALRFRFARVGELADLDEAIAVGRAAVQATPVDDPNRSTVLLNLGPALRARFERVGAREDLDEAITVARAAVQATPADHPNRAAGAFSNLGSALMYRFWRVGELADLDEVITVLRRAAEMKAAGPPDPRGRLSNLSGALQTRFEQIGALVDLDEAITIGRAAVQATAADDPNRAGRLSNFGGAVLSRFWRVGELADLDEAITLIHQAVDSSPANHPDRAKYLSNLGDALQLRFQRVGAQAVLDEAITTLAQAAEVESGAPSIRIRAARAAASLGAQADIRGAAELLEGAVRLLPETAPRQLHRGDQQYALGQFAGLASDATALALFADEADPSGENPATRALRLLELGRGVMLSQALDTRSDLTDLQARHPVLAARFVELRDQLDQAGETSVLADDAGMAAAWGERRVEDRHRLAAAFKATVTEIRGREGFETFVLPPEPDQLVCHAQQGPVVVVNVSRYRSDAILLRPEGITSIPLSDLVQGALIDRINSFHQALGAAHDPAASPDQRIGAQDTLSAVLEWLWDAAARPILDELGYRHTPVPGTAWPRLWWVPGGPLGFLPLHAAGYHREPPGADGRRTVMDRVVSSYTPTVRALGYAREHNMAFTAAERALIVAMPTTPGIDSPLRHVAEEAELVHARLPRSTLLIEDPATTDGHTPTKANVLAHLGGCAIVHFACHGSSHPVDPSRSLLLLHDHDTDPFTVASLAPIRLERTRLAYLSACRTAFNPSTDLVDEAIHLTTAFQLAGYPQVVGTLWEIDDALAVRIAGTFYTALATGPNTIDTRGAAQALHHAVRAIRDELPATPSLWAAYLHAGA